MVPLQRVSKATTVTAAINSSILTTVPELLGVVSRRFDDPDAGPKVEGIVSTGPSWDGIVFSLCILLNGIACVDVCRPVTDSSQQPAWSASLY